MKFTYAIFALSAVVSSASATPTISNMYTIQKRGIPVPEDLVPEFGVKPNQKPIGTTGDCEGFKGTPVPCRCPPDRGVFLKALGDNLEKGSAVNNTKVPMQGFPTDNSTRSKLARLEDSIITLQNFLGSGKGCPDASTNWHDIKAALIKELNAGTPSSTDPSVAKTSTTSVPMDTTPNTLTATSSTSTFVSPSISNTPTDPPMAINSSSPTVISANTLTPSSPTYTSPLNLITPTDSSTDPSAIIILSAPTSPNPTTLTDSSTDPSTIIILSAPTVSYTSSSNSISPKGFSTDSSILSEPIPTDTATPSGFTSPSSSASPSPQTTTATYGY